MSRNEIKAILTQLIKRQLFLLEYVGDENFEEMDIIDGLGVDSIAFISIIVEIENEFDIVIPAENLIMENFRKLDDIVEIIFDQIQIKSQL